MVTSLECTHRDVGGWKWMPLGAGSQWWPDAGWLGGCPYAREKARLKPSTES